jgi:CMP-N,N'-diacetyllegionaminic acid synthase
MINGKSVLAIIPARGGSKGLPGKNILPLAGKPLIIWSLEAARNSKFIDRCIVSTDDDKIVEIVKEFGGEIPFNRPAHLATDESTTFDVLEHGIQFFKSQSVEFDYLVLLEPTSPLRDSNDIDLSIKILHSNRSNADSIVGVSKVEATHPVFDVSINKMGLIQPFMGESFKIYRRQEIEELYFFEGSIYVSDIQVLLEEKNFYHDRTMPFIMPRWKSLEIDEMIDLLTAETIIKNISLIKKGNNE